MLIIANPAAHGGKGESAALFTMRFFSTFHNSTKACEVRLTEQKGDARNMAEEAAAYDTVVVIGGDGVIHEVASGLMTIPEDMRPALGVIAVGTGNDFARTFHMTRNDPEKAIAELIGGSQTQVDVGIANGTHFVQSLSFGLDAAIALDVSERPGSHVMGSSMYAASGLKTLAKGVHGELYRAHIDDEVIEGPALVLAIQNGPTYGGGFRVCPDARPDDGLLDVCLSVSNASVPRSLFTLGLMRLGRHTSSPLFTFRKTARLTLEFPQQVPKGQVDGETFEASSVEVGVLSKALRLIVPKARLAHDSKLPSGEKR